MKRTGYLGAIAALLIVPLLVLLAAGPALADGPTKRGKISATPTVDDYLAPPASAKSWTGYYASVGLGLASTETMGFELGSNMLCSLGGGYDHQINGTRIVVGIMGDVTLPCGNTDSIAELDISWYGALRLGALFSDHFLVYGSAGYTTTDFKTISGNLEGATLGVGGELMVTKHISFAVDWRHINQGGAGGAFEITTDEVRGVLRWRF